MTRTKRRVLRGAVADKFRETVNENVVTIISGNPNGSFLFYAYDIAAAINDGDKLRILPIVGRGGAHNVRDILYLRGIDMGITQSNTMTHYQQTGELGGNLANRLTYVTRLFVDEMHIAVRKDSGINSIADLNGKKVNYSNKGSGTQLTIRLVMKALGIKPIEFNMGQGDGFAKMEKGELDATICVCGSPLRSFGQIAAEKGFKMVGVPFDEKLENDYIPVTLDHENYPGMIPEGQSVETIGVSTVLAAYNWPTETQRYKRVAKFVNAFFDNFERMKQPPRRKKWRTVNLAANLKTWKRFPAAQEWLDKNAPPSLVSRREVRGTGINASQARAQIAEVAPNNPEEQARLFREFLDWMERRREQAGR
ncbi:MAG: TAXI family TRAP transporter solute-binding subunit [Pseudomonadota bacterium]